ncbi:MAG: hypothetical protein ABI887_06795 [Burkholderiales bacterium]
MKSLDTINRLSAERADIEARLEPLARKSAERGAELNSLRNRKASAEAELDAAIHQGALIEGRQLVGAATVEEVESAREVRQAAEKAHAATTKAVAPIRALEAEVKGLHEAAAPLGLRLHEITNELTAAREAYVAELAEDAAADYAAATVAVTDAYVALVALNRTMASMDGINPTLALATTDYMAIPAFNVNGARSANGWLSTSGIAGSLVPAAIKALRSRIAADGVKIPGL